MVEQVFIIFGESALLWLGFLYLDLKLSTKVYTKKKKMLCTSKTDFLKNQDFSKFLLKFYGKGVSGGI